MRRYTELRANEDLNEQLKKSAVLDWMKIKHNASTAFVKVVLF